MSASGLPVQLSVPSDARFRPIMLTMTRRIAESVGLSRRDADALGEEVANEATAAVRQAGADPTTPLDLVYEMTGQGLRVRASCRGASFEIVRTLPGA